MSRFRAPLALVFASALIVFAPTLAGAAGADTGDAKNEVSIDLAMPIALNLAVSAGGHAIPVYLCYERVLSDRWVLAIAPSLLYVDRVSTGHSWQPCGWNSTGIHPRTVFEDSSWAPLLQ